MRDFAGKRWFVPVCAAALFACGDGSSAKSSGWVPPDEPTAFTISGTISAAPGIAVDGDVNDPLSPVLENDTAEHAQVLPSAVTVAGWVDAGLDADDFYRAPLAAGQRVTLAIADAGATSGVDVDLCLLATADQTLVDCSMGTEAIEQLEVAEAGEYFVVVHAVSASSNYTLTLGAGTPAVATLRAAAEFVPGEVLVTFRRPAAAIAAARPLAAEVESMGLRLVDGGWDRPSLLQLPKGAARQSALAGLGAAAGRVAALGAPAAAALAEKLETLHAVKALRGRADVATADPNYVRQASAVPNDAYYPFQWHYPLIGLQQAWDVTTGAPEAGDGDVIVAVVDTGVFLAHPDLAGTLVPGYDFISSASRARDGDGMDANPDDPGDGASAGQSSWHGTHVAGTVAARANDATGVAGVSWGAKVMPIRALGQGGGTSADIMNGVRWAAGLSNASGTVPSRPADVINLSIGGTTFSATEQATYAAVRAAGVIVVAAAGNENTSVPSYPAAYDGVVSVSAVDLRRQRAPYSNYGPTVDLAAPGGDMSVDRNGDGYVDGVLSLLVDAATGTRKPIWGFLQGTSMASPHVAGVVALMKAVCPSLGPAQLDTLISSGAITNDLGAPGRDDLFGHGLVDALRAVQAAQLQCGVTPAASLQVTPPRLDFVPGQVAATLTAAKSGDGALKVVAVAADAEWLDVTASTEVDADGFGAWAVSVDPSGVADGRHLATITFTVEGGASVKVPVTLQKGALVSEGGAGYVYVLLLDATLEPIAQWDGTGAGGRYAFSFGRVPGAYALVAGTDYDDDGFICDAGEACGAWPTGAIPELFDVQADRTGLDFLVGFGAELYSSGADGAPPRRTFPITPSTKSLSRP